MASNQVIYMSFYDMLDWVTTSFEEYAREMSYEWMILHVVKTKKRHVFSTHANDRSALLLSNPQTYYKKVPHVHILTNHFPVLKSTVMDQDV